MKKFLIILLGIIVIVLIVVSRGSSSAEIVSADKVVTGAYTAPAKLQLTDNAKLTVEGPLTVPGIISCDNGPLTILVKGDAKIDGTLECDMGGAVGDIPKIAMNIVVTGSLTFGKDAKVISDGHVQIVTSEADILTDEQLEALYDETGQNTGTGPRIGPFVEGGKSSARSAAPNVAGAFPKSATSPFLFVNTAYAQVPTDKDANPIPNVILRGTWTIGDGGAPPSGVSIPTPFKGVNKIILNFAFGANGNVEIKDFHLLGPDGRDGKNDVNKNCVARGEKGEDAFRMRVKAAHITIDNFRIELGDGGTGGEAETTKDCDPGIATGGKGGEAGNFKMTAGDGIDIVSMHIVPGVGGNGGGATAHGKDGKDGCPGEKGGDATATGGDGGKNKKELAAAGSVGGIGNIVVDEVRGGAGGLATADPGKGGNGNACGCGGGKGGKGTATGGKGGDASATIQGGTAIANGGDGGDADAHGALGGNGGSCGPDKKGGNGGNGGDAKSKEGKAGTGTTAPGTDGIVKDETGGTGGNGGDGCGEGKGGKGGTGDPNGTDGKPGKRICLEEKKTGTTATPPTGGPTPPPAQTPPPSTHSVQVIQYSNHYLPLDQLIIENEAGCGANHYHAAQGYVIATDGSTVSDPGPQCGYGKVSEKPAMPMDVPNSQNSPNY